MSSTATLQYKAVEGRDVGQWLVIEFYHRPGYGACHTNYWNVRTKLAEDAIAQAKGELAQNAFMSAYDAVSDAVHATFPR